MDILTAEDLLPLLRKLSREERLRLARMALSGAAQNEPPEALAYRAIPPSPDEFSSEEDPLAWESEGWEEFDAPR